MIVRASLLVVSSVWLVSRAASACEPETCPDVVAVLDLAPVSATPVPIDGVLVLKADTLGAPDGGALSERVALVVTLDGTEVGGALAGTEFADVLTWRPVVPLQGGATYAVSATLSNPGADGVCGEAMATVGFEFTAAEGAAAPLVPATLSVIDDFFEEPVLTLTTIVCCDDAYPGDQTMCGVSYGATWSKGQCAPTQTRGFLRLQLNGTPGVDASSAGQWARVLRQDGEVVASGPATTFLREVEAPTCFRIDQVSLATGEVAEGEEQCVGEADAERLGVRAFDPATVLEGQCISDLYTCEIEDDRWDPMQCKSWGADAHPPEPTPLPAEDGCGCRSGGGAGLLAALVLVGGRRRRRGR